MIKVGIDSGIHACPQTCWLRELQTLDYGDNLPRPCNMAIQVTMASIRQPEIHEAIFAHDRRVISQSNDNEPGQCLLHVLGIHEWFAARGSPFTSLLEVFLKDI